MKILIIDIETTALKPSDGGMCEIGMIELNLQNGERTKIFDTLVNDKLEDRHRNAWVFNNTDIKFEQIKQAPKLEEIREEVQTIFNKYSGKITAWNQDFDFSFFLKRRFKIKTNLSCAMKDSTDYFKLENTRGYYGGYKWPKAQEAWNILFPDQKRIELHRAYDDAEFESHIIEELIKREVYQVN